MLKAAIHSWFPISWMRYELLFEHKCVYYFVSQPDNLSECNVLLEILEILVATGKDDDSVMVLCTVFIGAMQIGTVQIGRQQQNKDINRGTCRGTCYLPYKECQPPDCIRQFPSCNVAPLEISGQNVARVNLRSEEVGHCMLPCVRDLIFKLFQEKFAGSSVMQKPIQRRTNRISRSTKFYYILSRAKTHVFGYPAEFCLRSSRDQLPSCEKFSLTQTSSMICCLTSIYPLT